MVITCVPQSGHIQIRQELSKENWWALTRARARLCVSGSAGVLTKIVVMMSVVLKSVSVTLIDGSAFSMDSPSSECHRPICKDSACTNTHTHFTN